MPADRSPKLVGSRVIQVFGEVIPLVVAAYALRKGLGSDVLATVKAKLPAVLAMDVADVIRQLVEVLDGRLRRVGIGAEIQSTLIVKDEVWEGIETRVGEASGGCDVVVAVKAYADLIDEVGCEVVIFAEGDEVVDVGQGQKECREGRSGINTGVVVIDVASAEAVLRRDGQSVLGLVFCSCCSLEPQPGSCPTGWCSQCPTHSRQLRERRSLSKRGRRD